jgi:septum formation protein
MFLTGNRMKIVLASESPFRRRALDMLGLEYEVSPSRIDEKAIRDDNPLELTRKIAEAKARKVSGDDPDAIIVAGDAVAAKGSRIFEKPRDIHQADEFLHELSGSEFQFITALVVLHSRKDKEKMLSTVEVLNITFRKLLDREIQDYIAKYPVLNYAGAFENDAVYRFSERIEGSYNIGTAIPIGCLTLFLREFGVNV